MSRVNVEAVKSTRNAVRRQFYLLFIHSVVWRSVPFQWHTTLSINPRFNGVYSTLWFK